MALGDTLKNLSLLKNLNLQLGDISLGQNADNIRYLVEGMKGLTSLKTLDMNLWNDKLH